MESYNIKPGSIVSINSQWYRCASNGRLERMPVSLVVLVDMDTLNTKHLVFYGHHRELDDKLLPDEIYGLNLWDTSLNPDRMVTYIRATSNSMAFCCASEYSESIDNDDGDEETPRRQVKRKKK